MGDPFINPSLDSLPSPFNGRTVEGDFFREACRTKKRIEVWICAAGILPWAHACQLISLTRWQATKWPGATSSKGGMDWAQASVA